MLTLVDLGSGLWPYAHNATNASLGGYWNGNGFREKGTPLFSSLFVCVLIDLDMLEVGIGPDFLCSLDEASLARCRVHFTMYALCSSLVMWRHDAWWGVLLGTGGPS